VIRSKLLTDRTMDCRLWAIMAVHLQLSHEDVSFGSRQSVNRTVTPLIKPPLPGFQNALRGFSAVLERERGLRKCLGRCAQLGGLADCLRQSAFRLRMYHCHEVGWRQRIENYLLEFILNCCTFPPRTEDRVTIMINSHLTAYIVISHGLTSCQTRIR
jgi:hypothetical protein